MISNKEMGKKLITEAERIYQKDDALRAQDDAIFVMQTTKNLLRIELK